MFQVLLPVATASLFTQSIYYFRWRLRVPKLIEVFGFFIIIIIVDWLILEYAVFVLGFYIFYLFYLHLFALGLGLIYFGLKIFRARQTSSSAV